MTNDKKSDPLGIDTSNPNWMRDAADAALSHRNKAAVEDEIAAVKRNWPLRFPSETDSEYVARLALQSERRRPMIEIVATRKGEGPDVQIAHVVISAEGGMIATGQNRRLVTRLKPPPSESEEPFALIARATRRVLGAWSDL